MTDLSNLPNEIVTEVKNTLKAFDEVYVIFENGKYEVTTTLAVKKHYAIDHKFIGTFYAKDVFTPAERMENYINEFNDYPCCYDGLRNYDKLREARQKYNVEDGTLTRGVWKFDDNGNLQLIGSETIKF
jgi:hypothetical protein